MDKKQGLINELIKLADRFDRLGQVDIAAMLDETIVVLAESEEAKDLREFDIQVPDDEMEMLRNVLDSLKESLQ